MKEKTVNDALTIEEVYGAHDADIRRFIMGISARYGMRLTQDEREDVRGAVYEKLLRGALEHWRGECSMKSYLFRVTRSCALDFARRERVYREAEGDETIEKLPDAGVRDSAPDAVSKEESADSLVYGTVMEVTGDLDALDRRIFRLLFVRRLGQAETARRVGRSQSTVSARAARIRQMLVQIVAARHPGWLRRERVENTRPGREGPARDTPPGSHFPERFTCAASPAVFSQ